MQMIIGGALGRMGRELSLAAEAAGVGIACGVDVAYTGQPMGYPVVTGFEQVKETADVIVDFSRPEALPELLKLAVDNKMPVVLCAISVIMRVISGTFSRYSSWARR